MNLDPVFKYYKPNIILKKLLKEDDEYISSCESALSPSYNAVGTLKRKFPIASIKIDKDRFAFNNPIYQETVKTIFEYFNQYQWTPVFLDKEFYLRDGQHRLRVAELLNLKYIDVLILDNELMP